MDIKTQLKIASEKIQAYGHAELSAIRCEMQALSNQERRIPVHMTPARLRKAGIPGRLGADQLAKTYGLVAHVHGGGYWSYMRACNA